MWIVKTETRASLDDSLTLLCETLGKLKAANPVDITEVIEQLKMAEESARMVHALVSELDALIEEIHKSLEARTLEQLRSRLLDLATELERANIVHRRAPRVNELNQLRDQAINELRSQAKVEGTPQTLPGPEADRWIEWACGLKEPEDAESLQTLRNGFAHLDDFVAHLEPNMWTAAGSPTPEILPEPERSAAKTQPEQSRLQTNRFEPVVSSGPIQIGLRAAKSSGGRDELRFPRPLDELSLPALESNTLTPNDVTPPRTEEEIQRIQGQERALLASMMGLVSDPVRHFNRPVEPPFNAEVFREPSTATAITNHPVERPFTAEIFRETRAATAITSDIRTRVGEPRGGKWRMLLAAVAVLVFAALGAIQWRSHRNHTGNGPLKAIERKIPDLMRSNPENKGYDQSGMSTDSKTHNSSPNLQTEKQSKPKDQSVAPSPLSTAQPAKQASKNDDGALRPPVTIPKNIAKEEAPPNGATEVPDSVPGGLLSGVLNRVINIFRDIGVAQPKIAAQKVSISSGFAQGLLVHQVKPLYPLQARQARIEGTVFLQAIIGKDGTVQNVLVLRGHPMLIQAAVDAVRQWRYKPYYLNGEPVEAETRINVNFTL
jgi:periplasmic protein TonB